MRYGVVAAFTLFLSVLPAGCGSSQGILATGKARLDGKDLTRGEVLFVAVQGDAVRQGTIQPDGTFTVPDIRPGQYKVALIITPFADSDYEEGPLGKRSLKKSAVPVNIPAKVQDPNTSGITVDVISGRALVIDFSSK